MRLFLDTNIFLRYFTCDYQEMYSQSRNIFHLAEIGKFHLATSTIVLAEIIYTLKSFYHQDQSSTLKHINSILIIKNLFLVEKTDFYKAFDLFRKSKQKISDCLIATQIPSKYYLCSFDRKLEKLVEKDRFIHPKQLPVGNNLSGA